MPPEPTPSPREKERPRNVAAVRHRNFGPTRGRLPVASSALRAPTEPGLILLHCGRNFLAAGELTAPTGPAYIHPYTARRPRYGAMARLRSSSRINVKRLPMVVGGRGLRPFSKSGEHGTTVPGCLTSESEERETWTAESLRAVSRCGSNSGSDSAGRDFGGRRFRSTPASCRKARSSGGDPRQTL
jgi:hypothetical protein